MTLKGKNNQSLKETFIKRIQDMILGGELQPGERLPSERDLSQELGISRSLINVAISDLASQGFIHIKPRSGNYVSDYRREGNLGVLSALMSYDSDKMDPKLLLDMLEVRAHIEAECARLACRYAGEEELSEMDRQLDIMRNNEVGDSFIEASLEFHHQLTLASKNSVYAMIFRSISPVVLHFTKIYYRGDFDPENTIKLHEDILKSIRRKEEETASLNVRKALLPGETILKEKIGQNVV